MKFQINKVVVAGGMSFEANSMVDGDLISIEAVADLVLLSKTEGSSVVVIGEDDTTPIIHPAPITPKGGPKPTITEEPGTRPNIDEDGGVL